MVNRQTCMNQPMNNPRPMQRTQGCCERDRQSMARTAQNCCERDRQSMARNAQNCCDHDRQDMARNTQNCRENDRQSMMRDAHACHDHDRQGMTRDTQHDSASCGCASARADGDFTLPTGDRQKLLAFINEVSFGAYEALLFLDTHPCDEEALRYFHLHTRKRKAALKEYERLYGPLTADTITDSCSRSWEWMQQPWPWEGGAC